MFSFSSWPRHLCTQYATKPNESVYIEFMTCNCYPKNKATPTVLVPSVQGQSIGTLSNRRRRPDDGNRKREISFETSLRMYKTL